MRTFQKLILIKLTKLRLLTISAPTPTADYKNPLNIHLAFFTIENFMSGCQESVLIFTSVRRDRVADDLSFSRRWELTN